MPLEVGKYLGQRLLVLQELYIPYFVILRSVIAGQHLVVLTHGAWLKQLYKSVTI